MKKLLMLIVAVVGGWFAYMNWDSLTGNKPTTDDYVMKEYKKSMDKAREVEDVLKKAGDKAKKNLGDI